MDIEILPLILFMYTALFGILIIPSLILGYSRIKSAKNKNEKYDGQLALLAAVFGFFVYVSVDLFERIGLSFIWFLLMISVFAIPLYRVIQSLYGQKKTTNTKTVKTNKTSKKKTTKKK